MNDKSPKIKTNVLRLLDVSGVDYSWHEYPVADGAIDAVSVATKIGVAPEQMFKTLVTIGAPRSWFVYVIPAPTGLDLKKAAAAAGQKAVEMLPQRELLPLTGYIHGGCSPIGMKRALPTYIDECAQLYDRICVSGGAVGLAIAIAPADLMRLVEAQWADLTRNQL